MKRWFTPKVLQDGFKAALFTLALALSTGTPAHAQMDQGGITGTVHDSTGATVSGARITVTNVDTGLILESTTNESGTYVVSPIKIGNYKVTTVAEGFQTTTRTNLHVDLQQRLNVDVSLQAGAVSDSVTVNDAPPLIETSSGSTGQVVSTETINSTPLNGRNWVYIAHLTTGVTPAFGGTRGGGTGDFIANGQRAAQNNFILDGVDNNTNLIDFLNGQSYVVRPPPDALAEFKIETGDYSAEFGHSAGAVVNASVKSGTNQIHGALWEYFRNTNLDAKDWNATTKSPYHQNQFGATLGFPIIPNKLFYFGDLEANRISIKQIGTYSVPTALMRQGNFSELLNTSLTGSAQPVRLYQPNSGGTRPLTCNGQSNVFCANQINAVASRLLNLFPAANANNGRTFNNYVTAIGSRPNTFQWDQRVDWNATAKDQAFARFSYLHVNTTNDLPFGPILDGSGFSGARDSSLAENFMLSETHIFSSNLINEFRFGYNWGIFSFLQANANADVAGPLGLGGIPAGVANGGLPSFSVSGISGFGSSSFNPSIESQNVYQILDNVTKNIGNHSVHMGVNFQAIRVSSQQPPNSRGAYGYNGLYTGAPGVSFTGYGVADFLANQMNSPSLTSISRFDDARWYRAAYLQDDWKILQNLTLNLGLRYDYYQNPKENGGKQANFIPTSSSGFGTGRGVYQIPSRSRGVTLDPKFIAALAQNGTTIQYVDDERLASAQFTNFAPRLGFAYAPHPSTAIHGGFGLFYGGLQSLGGNNLGNNYPFQLSAAVPAPNCLANNCPSTGITLEQGFTQQIAQGLQTFISQPSFHATDTHVKTPYTMDYNLAMQQAFTKNTVFGLSYVGNLSRHLSTYMDPNNANALVNPGINSNVVRPFPGFGGIGTQSYVGVSTYNSLQAKLEQRLTHGLSFLVSYTWSHALDNTSDAGGLSNSVSYRNPNLLPLITELTNSPFDARHRFTVNGNYILPFGRQREFMNRSKMLDLVAGGWSTSYTFQAQTGTPFSVSPNISTANGGSARAVLVRDPFAAGGSPDPSNSSSTCAAQTRTRTNWYNPCSFANPLPGSSIGVNDRVTDPALVQAYLGGRGNTVYGPGYQRLNMSFFKDFLTIREQKLQFRADVFNILNHPSWGNPSNSSINSNGGQITNPNSFQSFTPDARFTQLALKYTF